MELISWMWVFDKRFFFNFDHSRDRILISWLLPCLFTAGAIVYMLIVKQGQMANLWYPIALGLVKIGCMGVLIWRQLNTYKVDWIKRSQD